MKSYLLIGIVILFSITEAGAQPPPPTSGADVGAPIDNDIVLLFIVTAAFGAWKLRKTQKFLQQP